MSIIKAIKQSFLDMERKGFDKLYYFVDLHSTCIKPNYTAGDIPTEFYPMAKEALQILSNSEEISLIMYTCSHPHEIEQYVKFFDENGIKFDYINENPEVTTVLGGYGNYDKKPYFNVLFEDKCGFDGETDWYSVNLFFSERYNLIENIKAFSARDIDQLYGEIDNEGFDYWMKNYSDRWLGIDSTFDSLMTTNNVDEIEEYFEKIGVIE